MSKIWRGTKCDHVEPVSRRESYDVGDSEPCVHCEDRRCLAVVEEAKPQTGKCRGCGKRFEQKGNGRPRIWCPGPQQVICRRRHGKRRAQHTAELAETLATQNELRHPRSSWRIERGTVTQVFERAPRRVLKPRTRRAA